MNKSKIEGEADIHISKQAKSIIYSVLEHEACENQRIPINPNLLTFRDSVLEYRYSLSLLCQKGNNQDKSKEFKNNLLMFYIFLTSYIVITITTSLLLYNEGNQKDEFLATRVIILGVILIFGYAIAYLIFNSNKFLMKSKELFAVLSIVLISYLVICDERVLSAIFSKDYEKNNQNHTLILACFLVMIRIVVFDSFFLFVILITITLVSSIALLLALSTLSPFAILSDYLVLFIFLLLQTIDCHQVEYRARQLFWRREQEEEALDPMGSQGEESDKAYAQINTEVELLLQACDKIKQNIKQASAVIMYKDVKTKLKTAQTEIEKVKRGIAHGLAMHDVKLDGNGELDEDDKVFISEYCMDKVSSDKARGRHQTMGDVREINPSFPFSTYGVAELDSVLFSVGKNWNFDIWFVYQVTGHSIFIVGKYLFEKWSFSTTFSIPEDTVDRFFQTLEKNYHQNPYHNACHAADVLHTLLYFLNTSLVMKNLNPVDIISLIVACLGHDVGHPALTNRFLINNRDELAFQYNDSSVLENMHIAKTYSIMNKQGCNIFESLDVDDWPKSRKLIIEMILETDMMKHFEILGRFRARAVNLADLALENQDDKLLILSMGLKCADIGHSSKILELHEKWTSLVCEEFFRQGDLEKQRKQQVSMYCDRDTTEVPKSQSGFIKNICMPLYEVWCSYLNNEEINKVCLDQLKKNLSFWDEKIKVRRSTALNADNSASANGNDKK